MANGKKQAEIAAAAVMRVLDTSPTESCIAAAAEIIELALHDDAREQEKKNSRASPTCRRRRMRIYRAC
jgi:hypothetical protein